MNWEVVSSYQPLFIEGAVLTLKCTVVCVILGTIWGLVLGVGRIASAKYGFWHYFLKYCVQLPVRVYVSAFRGTPLFVQIMVVNFVLLPLLINPRDGLLVTSGLIDGNFARMVRTEYGPFVACVVAITLNSGAYISEIFRAGIQSIDKGQVEAARSLGMGYFNTMRLIVLPQAFRRMLPPLGNNAISIVKDSSLGAAIGLADLAFAARTAGAAYASYAEPYLVISVVYWIITFCLSLLVQYLEKRLGRSD